MLKQDQRDEELSNVFKRIIRASYHKTLRISYKAMNKWHKDIYGTPLVVRYKYTGKKVPGGLISDMAAEYHKLVIKEGVKSTDGIGIFKLGWMKIKDVNPVNGKPRIVKQDGKYVRVIEDPFSNTPKYVYTFCYRRMALNPGVSAMMYSSFQRYVRSMYLTLAYKLHPKGNFYLKG